MIFMKWQEKIEDFFLPFHKNHVISYSGEAVRLFFLSSVSTIQHSCFARSRGPLVLPVPMPVVAGSNLSHVAVCVPAAAITASCTLLTDPPCDFQSRIRAANALIIGV